MMDIIKLLGKDNLLVCTILDGERGMLNSFSVNERNLATKAGISYNPSTGVRYLTKYQGIAFNLVFEADLPKDNKHYWCAEFLISENVEEEQTIPITVSNKDGKPISRGKLKFFGVELDVFDGKTLCTLIQLRGQLVKPKVSFALPESRGVRGHLVLW
jgi:hypothetical protein